MKELKKLIKRLGSQAKAAKELRVPPSQISDWMNGRRDFPIYMHVSCESKNRLMDIEEGKLK